MKYTYEQTEHSLEGPNLSPLPAEPDMMSSIEWPAGADLALDKTPHSSNCAELRIPLGKDHQS